MSKLKNDELLKTKEIVITFSNYKSTEDALLYLY